MYSYLSLAQIVVRSVITNIAYLMNINQNNNFIMKRKVATMFYNFVNIKNCSVSIMLTAMEQKPQKSLKGAITHHHIA